MRLYSPLLFYWARRAGLEEADAADLVQEVLQLLIQKLPDFQYDAQQSFRSWLRRVTLNKWHEMQRRKRPAVSGIEFDEYSAPDDADAFWEIEYRQHLVQRALTLMQTDFEERTWRACWECVVNDRSAASVASELGMTEGAIRAAKFRVLCRLRQELGGLWD
ncbi:MAG: sigma-70 family RNA polymerase sigma factor [Planctomycetaceae bacterium]|nr:sigma-70 family RNA polymerase sigma factor [Planctomycetales bacterium]MCB9923975.1 sigma-70 family RNA polymerase sigma factor [Planctomycetaceae bacterium]